jgi:hypothetical protein
MITEKEKKIAMSLAYLMKLCALGRRGSPDDACVDFAVLRAAGHF